MFLMSKGPLLRRFSTVFSVNTSPVNFTVMTLTEAVFGSTKERGSKKEKNKIEIK